MNHHQQTTHSFSAGKRLGALLLCLALALSLLPTTAVATGIPDVKDRLIYAAIYDETNKSWATDSSDTPVRLYAFRAKSPWANTTVDFPTQYTLSSSSFKEIAYDKDGDYSVLRDVNTTLPYNYNLSSLGMYPNGTTNAINDCALAVVVVPKQGYLIKSVEVHDQDSQVPSNTLRGKRFEGMTTDGYLRPGSTYDERDLGNVLQRINWDNLLTGDYAGQKPVGVFGYAGNGLSFSYTPSTPTADGISLQGFQGRMRIVLDVVQTPKNPVTVERLDTSAVSVGQSVTFKVRALTERGAAATIDMDPATVTRTTPVLTINGKDVSATANDWGTTVDYMVNGKPYECVNYTYVYKITQEDYEYAQAHDNKIAVSATADYTYASPAFDYTSLTNGYGVSSANVIADEITVNVADPKTVTFQVPVPGHDGEYLETYTMSVPEGSSVSAVQTTDAATTAKNPLAPALRDYLKVDNATGLNNYTTTTGQVYNQNNTNGDSAAWSSYYFKQWTKDGTTYDLTTPVTEDITLTADYTTAMYVVFHGVNPTDPDNRDADLFTYKTFIQLNGTANLLGGQWKIGDTLTDIITAWNNTDYVKYFGYTAASAPPNDGTDYSEYYLEEWTRDLTTVFSAPFDLTRTPVTADMLDGTGTLHLYTRWAKEEADEFNLIFLLENAAWDNGSKMPKVVQLKKEGTDTDLTNLDLSAITDDIVLADANYDVTNGTVTYCVPAPQDYTFPTGNTVNGQPEMLTLSAATVGNTAVGVDQLPSYSTQNWSTPATIAQVKANTPKIPNIVDTVFIKFSAVPQVVYQNATSGAPANITTPLPAAQAYTSGATVNVAADLTTDSVSNTAGQKGVWTFNGWSDGTTTYKAGETFTMPATPVTLTASWTFTAYKDYQVTYQVTADANYGVPDARADLKDTYLETAEVTVRAPLTSTVGAATKDGQRVFGTWSFSAWTLTGNTDGVTIRNNTFTMPGHDVTFTGAWSFTPTPTHKVTYEVTGADKPTYTPDSIAETDRAEGQTVTVAAAPTTAWNTQTGTDDGGTEGYWSFSGWKTTDVANYKVGDGTFTMPTKDVKFTGSWTFVAAPRYNLKYVITDEAGTDLTPYLTNPDLFAPTTYGKGQTVSISYPVLNRNTKTGRDDSGAAGIWTFSGWTITKDTDNSEINPTNYQFEMPDDHVTLTGKFIFTPTYTVTYSVTGDKPGDMNPGSFPTNVYVTGNTVTVAGYPTTAWNTQTGKDDSGDAGTWTFSGWADGGTTYKEGDTFAMPDRNVVLTGSWTFQKTGGGTPPATTSDPAPTSSTGVDKVLNTSEHVAFLLGYQDGSFRPDNDMTRAEAAMMFYRLLLDKETDAEQQFPDVPQDAWYAEAVRVLTANNIIYGYQDGYYRPEYPITRAQFTAIAMRFAFPPTEGESVYSDVEPDDWFYADVVGATQYGWISGYGDGTFRPDDTISRAEVAAIMNRMLGRQADESFAEHFREHLRQFNDLPLDYWAYHHIVEASNPHTYQSLWEKIDERLTDRMEKIENWLNLKK